MSRVVQTVFRSSRIDPDRIEFPRFQARAGADWLEVSGRLSTGRSGWVLSAAASVHRENLVVTVTARGSGTATPDIEEFAYTVVVVDLPPGSYWLQVSHGVWVAGMAHHVTESLFEARVWLPAEDGSAVVQAQRVRATRDVPVGRLKRRSGAPKP